MEDPSHDDVHCMERLREGDDLALNYLMGRWKEPLVSFCFRYTGNLADALEIVQETIIKVYGSRHRYRPKAAFSTWLFTIAVNLCKMRARWKSRHPEILEADGGSKVGQQASSAGMDGTDPGIETDRNALANDLDHAIQSLPHELRVAFVLFEMEGHSYREVAAVLKCTEKAVERRLARAREDLRSILEPKWRN